MDVFDTTIFAPPLLYPKCRAETRPNQTKAFDCIFDAQPLPAINIHSAYLNDVAWRRLGFSALNRSARAALSKLAYSRTTSVSAAIA